MCFIFYFTFISTHTRQDILSQECLSLQFLDVVTILLKYCGPHTNGKGETQAVIVDLVATLGFFCANNEANQVRIELIHISTFSISNLIEFSLH